jgi:membrane protein DedA with SNARE-associated domain
MRLPPWSRNKEIRLGDFIAGLLEWIVAYLKTVEPLHAYLIVFAIAYIENIFPPSPSDAVVVFVGSLTGLEAIGFVPTLLAACVGSTLGFMTMYKIGDVFGDRILETGKIKFIPVESVRKVEAWFGRYGYWIIVINRFLAGTRAVVSFFAGMSELDLVKTTLLSFVSSLAWNAILVTAGYYVGANWQVIVDYVSTYGRIMTIVVIALLALFIVRHFIRRKPVKVS